MAARHTARQFRPERRRRRYKDGRAGLRPQQLRLCSQLVLSRSLLNQFELEVENKSSVFSHKDGSGFGPAQTVKKCSFPGRLDNKGAVSGSELQYRKSIFSALFSRSYFLPHSQKLQSHLIGNFLQNGQSDELTLVCYQVLNDGVRLEKP